MSNYITAVSAGNASHLGVGSTIYSMVLTKEVEKEVLAGQLVALDSSKSSSVYVKHNQDQVDTKAYGVITKVETSPCTSNGVGLTQVNISVLTEPRTDVWMYSEDNFTKEDLVYAGADGAVAKTGTLVVGVAVSSSESLMGVDGVIRNYFVFKMNFESVERI